MKPFMARWVEAPVVGQEEDAAAEVAPVEVLEVNAADPARKAFHQQKHHDADHPVMERSVQKVAQASSIFLGSEALGWWRPRRDERRQHRS